MLLLISSICFCQLQTGIRIYLREQDRLSPFFFSFWLCLPYFSDQCLQCHSDYYFLWDLFGCPITWFKNALQPLPYLLELKVCLGIPSFFSMKPYSIFTMSIVFWVEIYLRYMPPVGMCVLMFAVHAIGFGLAHIKNCLMINGICEVTYF